jgi:hypothetical protein
MGAAVQRFRQGVGALLAFARPLDLSLAAGYLSPGLLGPFVVAVQHPVWSAEDIAAAGGSDSLVWLAAHHADPLDRWRDHALRPLLERLQRADDTN